MSEISQSFQTLSESDSFSLGQLEKWALLSASRHVLRDVDFMTKTQADFLKMNQFERTTWCNRRMVSSDITVWKSVEHNKTHFSGLGVCGSVWACPVCAPKITEFRRRELHLAHDNWMLGGSGRRCFMITYTIPHNVSESLATVRKAFMSARKRLKNSRAFKWLRVECGLATFRDWQIEERVKHYDASGNIVNARNKNRVRTDTHYIYTPKSDWTGGTASAIELTFGSNGWHLHCHELWFIDTPVPFTDPDGRRYATDVLDLAVIQDRMSHMWLDAVRRSTKKPINADHVLKRGIDLTSGKSVIDYVSKFGSDLFDGETFDDEQARLNAFRSGLRNQRFGTLGEKIRQATRWGAPEELTKSHLKNNLKNGEASRRGGITPWDMLRKIVYSFGEIDIETGLGYYPVFGKLFAEYAREMKGSRQLFFSPRFRQNMDMYLDEMSDQEIAESVEDVAVELGRLSWSDWQKILHHEKRGEILALALDSDWSVVRAFIDSLSVPPASARLAMTIEKNNSS